MTRVFFCQWCLVHISYIVMSTKFYTGYFIIDTRRYVVMYSSNVISKPSDSVSPLLLLQISKHVIWVLCFDHSAVFLVLKHFNPNYFSLFRLFLIIFKYSLHLCFCPADCKEPTSATYFVFFIWVA